MKVYEVVNNCRLCESESLTQVIKIEDQYLSPIFVEENSGPMSKIKVPHTLLLCNECKLLQLKETVNPDLLYKGYFYRSAISDTMRADLKEVVKDVVNRVELNDGDCVLDIGANDCTMISYYPDNLLRYGIEPAENIDWSGVDKNIKIVNDYFTEDSVVKCNLPNKVKIFTSCAMFYDLDDPNSFVKIVKDNLHERGVFCIQLSYLPAMLINLNFYDICNEHLEYYSLSTLNKLMHRHGLEIYHAQENAVNGGSIRTMITHKKRDMEKTTEFLKLLEKEEKMNLGSVDTYLSFYEKIMDMKEKVVSAIEIEMKTGLVIGLGASTKGNMLLQTFGLTKEEIPYISERNPDKVGLRTLGTDIILISEEYARLKNPGMMVVLPWYFKDEIIKRESEYIKNGGKLLIPMPYPHIIDASGETIL